MKDLNLLKKDICLGNLVMVESNEIKSAVIMTKKMLSCVGINPREVKCLTAEQFSKCDYGNFSNMFLKPTRVLLISDLEQISEEARNRFLNKLEKYKTFKHRYDVSLVLVSMFGKRQSNFLEDLEHKFQLCGPIEPLEMNEIIHDMIENYSAKQGKVIWKIQAEVAEIFEEILILEGEHFLEKLICYSIQDVQSRELGIESVVAAYQKVISSVVKIDLS